MGAGDVAARLFFLPEGKAVVSGRFGRRLVAAPVRPLTVSDVSCARFSAGGIGHDQFVRTVSRVGMMAAARVAKGVRVSRLASRKSFSPGYPAGSAWPSAHTRSYAIFLVGCTSAGF